MNSKGGVNMSFVEKSRSIVNESVDTIKTKINMMTGNAAYPDVIESKKVLLMEMPDILRSAPITSPKQLTGSVYMRIAGLLGATAVALSAYGAHVLMPKKEVPEQLKGIFTTANFYHFIHALALLAVPFCRRPNLVGILFLLGIFLFCGTCYITALTGDRSVSAYTPYGGMCLIVGWLSMAL